MDRWILSRLDRLTGDVVAAMDAYDLQQAVRPLVQFIDDLTNWYIRRSRRRFWKRDDDADKTHAYETLHTVLLTLCQVAAPFVPFISEEIYRNLRTPDMPESVHLCDFPLPGKLPRDTALEAQMAHTQEVVGLARQLRAAFNLKVRQPLAALTQRSHPGPRPPPRRHRRRRTQRQGSALWPRRIRAGRIKRQSQLQNPWPQTRRANEKGRGRHRRLWPRRIKQTICR